MMEKLRCKGVQPLDSSKQENSKMKFWGRQ